MANYVVAVSGGVDSVALLDALCTGRRVGGRYFPAGRIIVAHFDHGIRDNSKDDAELVGYLAKMYDVPFVTKREELGAGASEELARTRRYAFLYDVCRQYGAQLVTAHHGDDIVETVAINVIRGTGWRGVAVLDTDKIYRPFLSVTKQDIIKYAKKHTLHWHEDSTNDSDVYLRNRVRKSLQTVDDDTKLQIRALHARQVEIKQLIDIQTRALIGDAPYDRYFFGNCGDKQALELLRQVCIAETGVSPVIEQRERALLAIKVALPGHVVHVGDRIALRFTRREFTVESTRR